MRKLISIIWFASLLSCTTKPPDVPVCERITQRLSTDPITNHLMLTPSPLCMERIGEAECGHCTYIMSGKEIHIGELPKNQFNKKPWSQLQRESILVPAIESYSPLSAYIINECEKDNCSSDVQKFKVKLDSLNGVGDLLHSP